MRMSFLGLAGTPLVVDGVGEQEATTTAVVSLRSSPSLNSMEWPSTATVHRTRSNFRGAVVSTRRTRGRRFRSKVRPLPALRWEAARHHLRVFYRSGTCSSCPSQWHSAELSTCPPCLRWSVVWSGLQDSLTKQSSRHSLPFHRSLLSTS